MAVEGKAGFTVQMDYPENLCNAIGPFLRSASPLYTSAHTCTDKERGRERENERARESKTHTERERERERERETHAYTLAQIDTHALRTHKY